MKITYMNAAQGLLLLTACLPAAAQAINPNHGSDGSSQISAGTQEAQVRAPQQQLKSYEQQLQAKAEQVEKARQEAISAGIQGDGAAPFIDAYRQEQKELEVLQTALAPQIEQVRATIAALSRMDSQASLASQKADSRKAKKSSDLMASRTASNLRAATK